MPSASAATRKPPFDPAAFLSAIDDGRTTVLVTKKSVIFAQGDPSDSVYYIERGRVRLTVVARSGKEATIGILNAHDFFGEGCLAGPHLRMWSATAMADCSLIRVEKKTMAEALRRKRAFSDMFVAYLLARNIHYEQDLVDQLSNFSEKRLARVLLLLAHAEEGKPEGIVSKISQETLAEMVGTTRSRVNFFMNRFRESGYIRNDGELKVNSSLINVVLADQRRRSATEAVLPNGPSSVEDRRTKIRRRLITSPPSAPVQPAIHRV